MSNEMIEKNLEFMGLLVRAMETGHKVSQEFNEVVNSLRVKMGLYIGKDDKKHLEEDKRDIEICLGYTKRDEMIKRIKEINQKAYALNDRSLSVTKLYYRFNDKIEFVEDYSFFTTEEYMSKGLLEAIYNRSSLTTTQQSELNKFIIEGRDSTCK